MVVLVLVVDNVGDVVMVFLSSFNFSANLTRSLTHGVIKQYRHSTPSCPSRMRHRWSSTSGWSSCFSSLSLWGFVGGEGMEVLVGCFVGSEGDYVLLGTRFVICSPSTRK